MPTSPSLYEQLFPLTTVMKVRVIENFSGDTLDERWTQTNIAGAGTFAIVDVPDEGFSVLSGATSANESQINFNNIRHYAHDTTVCISVFRAVATTSNVTYSGLSGNILTWDGVEKALAVMNSANANFGLSTADATTSSTTQGSVAIDTTFRDYKIENGSSDIKLTLTGTLDVTKTTNRPTVKMQPVFGVKTTTGSAKETRIRFIEAFNI